MSLKELLLLGSIPTRILNYLVNQLNPLYVKESSIFPDQRREMYLKKIAHNHIDNSKMGLKLNKINGYKDCFSKNSRRNQLEFGELQRNIYDASKRTRGRSNKQATWRNSIFPVGADLHTLSKIVRRVLNSREYNFWVFLSFKLQKSDFSMLGEKSASLTFNSGEIKICCVLRCNFFIY